MADIQDKLLDHHITVSYSLIGLVVLLILAGSVFAYFGNKSYEQAMARAEAAEKQLDADRAQYQQTLLAMQKQIDSNNQQIAVDQAHEQDLVNQISKRDVTANNNIQQVLKPGATATEAYANIASAYRGVASFPQNIVKDPNSPDQLLAFPVPAVQQFTAAELAEQRDSKDLSDTQAECAAMQDENNKLRSNLTATDDSLTALQKSDAQCQQTLQDYKRVAQKSRLRKILDGFKKGAEIGGALLFGYELGHRL